MADQLIRRLNISGPDVSEIFELPPGKTVVGRQAGIDIRLNNPMISRRHIEVECSGKECQITDLGSANGSAVNGEKIEANSPRVLAPGDVIELGPFKLAYEQVVLAAPKEVAPKKKAPAKKKPARPKKAADKPAAKPAAKEEAKKEPAPPPTPPKPPRPTRRDSRRPEPDYSQPPPGLDYESRRLIEYLPGIYHTDFMLRFLAIFEAIYTPAEWNIDNFDMYLDPNTAPEGFLPWLANWFSISFDPSWSVEKRRTLLSEAHLIYAKRGTRWSLSRALEIYTGSQPEIEDLLKGEDPFTFNIKIPIAEKEVDRALIENIIDISKPAHTNYILKFQATRSKRKTS